MKPANENIAQKWAIEKLIQMDNKVSVVIGFVICQNI